MTPLCVAYAVKSVQVCYATKRNKMKEDPALTLAHWDILDVAPILQTPEQPLDQQTMPALAHEGLHTQKGLVYKAWKILPQLLDHAVQTLMLADSRQVSA